MAFTTIQVAPDLMPTARRRANRSGPPAVATRSDYSGMLTSAGFVDIDQLDVTADFVGTAQAWISERDARRADLEAIEPAGWFDERRRASDKQLRATMDGLLRRGLFSARRPV